MKSTYGAILSILFGASLYGAFTFFASAQAVNQSTTASSSTPQSRYAELRGMINQKSSELQAIQAERERLEKTLQETSKSSNTLASEIKKINGNISQLDLSIRANKLVIDKLGLEISSLDDDIQSTESQIQGKKDTIGKLFVELQKRDKENVLIMVLRNNSLHDSVSEAESIVAINTNLSKGIVELRDLRTQLAQKLNEESNTKKTREIETANLANRQLIIQDQKNEKQNLLAQTKDQEKVYKKQLDDLIKRQIAISDEVEKIESELRTKIDPTLLPIPRPGVLAVPVTGYRISQEYGNTQFAKNGYRGHFHNGLDLAAPLGTPITAAEAGTVEASGDQDKYCRKGAYGKFVVISHANNLTTLYGHLSRIAVQTGQQVQKGDVIGYVGSTGYATGPHLHFTVYAGPTFYMGSSNTCGPMPYGGDLNPSDYLAL